MHFDKYRQCQGSPLTWAYIFQCRETLNQIYLEQTGLQKRAENKRPSVFVKKMLSHKPCWDNRVDCWCLGRAQESDGCCLQTPERATKSNQGNTTAEWGGNANAFRNILNKLSPVSWFKWTPVGLRGIGVLWLWLAKREHSALQVLEASDLSLQVVQYLLAQHQHGNRIIGFEKLFPWSGLYPLKKIEQLNFFFLKRINRLWTVTLVARCITRDFHLLKHIVSG